MFACHGTPGCDSEYLLDDVSRGFAVVAAAGDIRSRIGALTGLVLCGHSHMPRLVRVDETTAVANPGSAGLQAYYDSEHRFPHAMETGSPHARYLLIEQHASGWDATLRVLEYDWERASRLAEAGLRPDWSYALRTGYALRG